MIAEKGDFVSVLVASDLDRTLIYSPSALQLTVPDEEFPTLVVVEALEGRPHSFMTLRTAENLHTIDQIATFCPITTRTIAQYQRVRFSRIEPRLAITSNGGNILVDGKPDEEWQATMTSAIRDGGVGFDEVRHELKQRAHDEWVLKRRIGDHLFCYVVVDQLTMPADFLTDWRAWCEPRGWKVSVQGRKIYAIPGPLSKEAALAEVSRRTGATTVLAAGDGALDAGFLAAATAGIRPPHGELASQNWTHPTVAIADTPGVLAAEEMTDWFLAQIAATSSPLAAAAASI